MKKGQKHYDAKTWKLVSETRRRRKIAKMPTDKDPVDGVDFRDGHNPLSNRGIKFLKVEGRNEGTGRRETTTNTGTLSVAGGTGATPLDSGSEGSVIIDTGGPL